MYSVILRFALCASPPFSLLSNSLWSLCRPWTQNLPALAAQTETADVWHYAWLCSALGTCSNIIISIFPSFPLLFKYSCSSFYLSKVSNTYLNLSEGGWAKAASSPAQHSDHNNSYSNLAANMSALWHFRLIVLSATMSRTWPFRDGLGLCKAYPAQYAYFIPLFYFNILSIKKPFLMWLVSEAQDLIFLPFSRDSSFIFSWKLLNNFWRQSSRWEGHFFTSFGCSTILKRLK